MNDRYLYRAKRADNGKWVKGLLTMMWGQLHIVSPEEENTAYQINEATISHCTCKPDDTENLAFEHDIIYSYELEAYGRIYWDEDDLLFSVLIDGNRYGLGEFKSEDFEIKGNIFDNPELKEPLEE